MSDEATTQHPEGGDDKLLAPLAAVFNKAMEKREQNFVEVLEKQIALLGGTPAPADRKTAGDIADAAVGRAERGNGSIVSRYQPTDPLYRSLHRRQPHMAEYRTPDLDHWNAEWLRAFLAHDSFGMKTAYAKSHEAAGLRADTLGGALDASDPTAIASGTGGHLLPQPYANLVMIAREAAAVIAPLCTNFTTSGLTIRVPTAGAVTADTIAEGASGAQGEPTFASEMMILHKIGARMIASEEMLQDTAFNLMSIYGERAGAAIGAAEDTQICTTDGVAPNLTEAIAGGNVDEATTTVLVYEDLNTLFFSLGKAYQPNATFLAGTVVCTLLSNLMDGNDHPILKIPSQAPSPVTDATPQAIGTVLGRPIYHVPLAAGTLILGDLRGYGFVRKGGIFASMSTEVGFATDTIQFKFYERVDGRIIDDVAMKQMAALATVA
jgi:HK97 family phage major capsid protein